jgi:hypothetical protein
VDDSILAVAIGVLRIGAVGRKTMLVAGAVDVGGNTILVRAAAGVEKDAVLVSTAVDVKAGEQFTSTKYPPPSSSEGTPGIVVQAY